MSFILLVGFLAVALWSLVGRRLEALGFAGPAVLALIGAAAVFVDPEAFTETLNSPVAEHTVEVVLALLLFVDACEVRGGIFGGHGRTVMRLVLIALPLSLLLVVAVGVPLLPRVEFFVLVVIACIVMPTDFAPAASLLRSPKIPARLRQILNVESGYNDGLVSPVFSMSLAIALVMPSLVAVADSGQELDEHHLAALEPQLEEFGNAFVLAVPATLVAILIGTAIGSLFGVAVRVAVRRGLASTVGVRGVMLIVPLLTYLLATLPGIDANGFVAAFVAGVAYRTTRTRHHDGPRTDGSSRRRTRAERREARSMGEAGVLDRDQTIPHDELVLVEEAGTLAANFVWFVLGALLPIVVMNGFDWPIIVVAVLALTLLRMGPVWLSLLGTRLTGRERTLIGFVGPRGTASIVFGLLAYNRLPEGQARNVLAVMVFTVVGSILLHSVLTPLMLKRMTALAGSPEAEAEAGVALPSEVEAGVARASGVEGAQQGSAGAHGR